MKQAKYKKKKRSCALCKPHKMKWADKCNCKERDLRNKLEEEIEENCRNYCFGD